MLAHAFLTLEALRTKKDFLVAPASVGSSRSGHFRFEASIRGTGAGACWFITVGSKPRRQRRGGQNGCDQPSPACFVRGFGRQASADNRAHKHRPPISGRSRTPAGCLHRRGKSARAAIGLCFATVPARLLEGCPGDTAAAASRGWQPVVEVRRQHRDR
jgi:hypothetical protein